jgi:hypothetical protein
MSGIPAPQINPIAQPAAPVPPRRRAMDTMTVLLTLEASQPYGKTYRLGFGCNLHLASMIALITRLF